MKVGDFLKELLMDLHKLFTKELLIANNIYEKTKEMTIHIQEEEAEKLIVLIEERELLMEKSEETKTQIANIMKRLSTVYNISRLGDIGSEYNPQVKKVLSKGEKIQKIYKEAFKLEKQNQSIAKESLEKYKNTLIGIQQGKRVQEIYKGQANNQRLFLNSTR